MGKHYWRETLPKVLEMKENGYTHRVIAEELGYSMDQIKRLIERYNRKERTPQKIPLKRGRPRIRPLVGEQEYLERIKQLEMENELLRSFLQAAGRV
jgi:transposase